MVGIYHGCFKKDKFRNLQSFYVGEDFENPCLYMGEPKENRGYPTIFRLLNGSPVMKKRKICMEWGRIAQIQISPIMMVCII